VILSLLTALKMSIMTLVLTKASSEVSRVLGSESFLMPKLKLSLLSKQVVN
jgi:hypothetical protein